MCFQGPRDGVGLLETTAFRGGAASRAPLAVPLTKCRYATVTRVPTASAMRMGSSHTRARLGGLRGLRPRAVARETRVPAGAGAAAGPPLAGAALRLAG